MNEPPRLFALRGAARALVFDPNPGLLTRFRFARVDTVRWTARDGASYLGGLYYPPDYRSGQRYPVVIQTHGFLVDQFWPDGVYSTGNAAQALAGLGILVLQSPGPADFDTSSVLGTDREGPMAMAAFEAAVDHLDDLGWIDRTRVGLSGFSRTCFYVGYTLTHTDRDRYPFAAASVIEGVDMSYGQYILFGPVSHAWGVSPEEPGVNGGAPWGPTTSRRWVERAPGFNLDRVRAPIRIQALHPASLLSEWELYAGLLLQRKPVELVYLPDAQHIIATPWELLTSQQGNVDWFRFWLKGEEDPDTAKGEQYARWRQLRELKE